MGRYYLTDVIGDGNPDNGNDFRSPLHDYGLHVECEVPWDDVRNVPLNPWVLVEVRSGDVSLFADDTRVMPLPEVSTDTEYGDMTLAQRTALHAALDRWAIAVNPAFTSTFGEILGMIRIRANAGNNKPASAQLAL